MVRDARSYLWDIQDAANAIVRFTQGLNAETFAESEVVHAAVERKFEIIGEALNQLSRFDPILVQHIPDFRDIVSFRNLLIHGYAIVDLDQVWHAVVEALPGLGAVVAACSMNWGRLNSSDRYAPTALTRRASAAVSDTATGMPPPRPRCRAWAVF